MNTKKIALIIMDGWGLGQVETSDAIQHARVPFYHSLYQTYPNTRLITCGEAVGLPEGQMGNSEVGHLNLGAGRVVYQELQRINVAIREGSWAKNPALLRLLNETRLHDKTLHLMGLVSDGGVHSHLHHLQAILTLCHEHGLKNVMVHAFTDGRDTDPRSGKGFLQQLSDHMRVTTGTLATVTGRYYAMDRDKRWERIKVAYDALVHGTGTHTDDILDQVQHSYDKNVTDEFLMPLINQQVSDTRIKEGDSVFCFNFRTDRCREITEALTQRDFPDQQMQALRLDYTTMTCYDETYQNVHVVFENDNLTQTLGEVLSKQGKTQLRIAETEKYPHVTFFFSGGRETPFAGESRIMIPSPKVATYDLKPEMSAPEVTEAVIQAIQTESPDFICLNFANPDMVGHTGVWEAVVKAVETVDQCVQKVVEAALAKGYSLLITADHGNADYVINADGSPHTAHTLNPVPLFLIDPHSSWKLKPGKLGDIAPTILRMMDIPIPQEMTGTILVENV